MDALTKRIVIVGVGPGSPDWLTVAARRAIDSARLLTGAQRLLDLFEHSTAAKLPFSGGIDAWLEQVAHQSERIADGTLVVLVSGDPGISSLATAVLRRFGVSRCRVIAGVSSVQLACAALGLAWDNAAIVSAHGSVPDALAKELESRDPWVILMGAQGAEAFVSNLVSETGRVAYRCEDLSLPSESVRQTSCRELSELPSHPRRIVVLTRELPDEF